MGITGEQVVGYIVMALLLTGFVASLAASIYFRPKPLYQGREFKVWLLNITKLPFQYVWFRKEFNKTCLFNGSSVNASKASININAGFGDINIFIGEVEAPYMIKAVDCILPPEFRSSTENGHLFIDLDIGGAKETNIWISDKLKLESLNVKIGMGNVNFKADGNISLHSKIKTGMGNIEIHLSLNKGVGVKLLARTGLGELNIDAEGLSIAEKEWNKVVLVSPGYTAPGRKVYLEVDTGVGSIEGSVKVE